MQYEEIFQCWKVSFSGLILWNVYSVFKCTNARTYRECREKGEVEYCTKEQNSCFIETVKEKVPRYAFPDYDVHKGREGIDLINFWYFHQIRRFFKIFKSFKSIKGDVIRVEITMGCKQPEACYANKKQNFLVRAGRQCFPKNSMSSTLAYGIDSVSFQLHQKSQFKIRLK